MRENRPYGSEGGERKTFPTPIPYGRPRPAHWYEMSPMSQVAPTCRSEVLTSCSGGRTSYNLSTLSQRITLSRLMAAAAT